MILIIAFVAPYALASDVPSQAFRQFNCGSATFVCPPRTTNPAIEILDKSMLTFVVVYHGFAWDVQTYNNKVRSLTMPNQTTNLNDHLVFAATTMDIF